jgi:hypothetical protein
VFREDRTGGFAPVARSLALTVILALQLSRALWSASTKGPAADEPRHLATGVWYLVSGACCLGAVDTPASTLSAWAFLGDRDAAPPLPATRPSAHAFGASLLERPGTAGRLLRARLVSIAFGLVMTLAVWFLARRVSGEEGALFAAALTALDPSLLGHGHLVSPDFLAAALFPVAGLAGVRVVERPSSLRGALFGIALCLLFLTKYSALLPVGILAILVPVWPGTDGGTSVERMKRRAKALAVALGVAGILVLAAYRVPSHAWYWPIGLKLTHRLVAGGYPSFLLGEYGRGWLHYFLVATLVKVPLPTLGTALAGVVIALRRWRRVSPALPLIVLPAAGLFAAASLSRYDLGIRHVLVVIPALSLLGGLAIATLRPTLRAAAVLATVAYLLTLGDGIPYGNQLARLAGGLDRVLSDSNVDWGEDVPLLARWRAAHREGEWAAAVVSPLPLSAWGLDAIELPGTTPHAPPGQGSLPPDLRWVAISTMDLQGTLFVDHDRYALFRSRTPAATVGETIRVFDLAGDPEARRHLDEIRERTIAR